MPYSLMLASPNPYRDPAAAINEMMKQGGWSWEFKMDGIRALIQVRDGTVAITNRNGRDITYRYPDVVATATGLGDMVLDGEIICADAQGRPDFHRIHRRDAQVNAGSAAKLSRTYPAQFVVFDVLTRAGVDLRALSYVHRGEQLRELAQELAVHGVTCPPVSTDGAMMWRVVCDMGLEGLVAKRHDSRYTGKRSPAWVKIKRTHRLSALVVGHEAGEGSRARTFGALSLALHADGEWVPVGTVGSGFTEQDVTDVWGMLRRKEVIVVEVAYLEMSPGGQLRQPVFKGLRQDLSSDDCSMDQVQVGPKG